MEINLELIRNLEQARAKSNNTSLVTLYIPGKTKVSDMNTFITSELSKAPNIKSRVTRQNVIEALKSIASAFKLYKSFPENGLVIFNGITTEKKISQTFTPVKPVTRFLYRCDNQFYV